MTDYAALVGKQFFPAEVSQGSWNGRSFTEQHPFDTNSFFGFGPLGPDAVITVTAISYGGRSNAGPNLTISITHSSNFVFNIQPSNGMFTGFVIAEDGTSFLLNGDQVPGFGNAFVFFTDTPGKQPGTGNSVTLADYSAALVSAVPCFCAGTLIATPDGLTAVEAVGAGSTVSTTTGPQAVVWTGRRHVLLADHPNRAAVQPVRVTAGALGRGLPRRDLLLSPEHAVFLDGVLVPVHTLCGCPGIATDWTMDATSYHHVELARHALLLAEGAPCESWLDTGNRAMIGQGVGRAGPSTACAPILAAGPAHDAIRRRLGAAAPHEAFVLTAGHHSVRVPPGAGDVRIRSTPAICPPDRRTLGIAIASMAIDDAVLQLDDRRLGRGFHALDGGVRWSDGSAHLSLGPSPVERMLTIEVAAAAAAEARRAG